MRRPRVSQVPFLWPWVTSGRYRPSQGFRRPAYGQFCFSIVPCEQLESKEHYQAEAQHWIWSEGTLWQRLETHGVHIHRHQLWLWTDRSGDLLHRPEGGSRTTLGISLWQIIVFSLREDWKFAGCSWKFCNPSKRVTQTMDLFGNQEIVLINSLSRSDDSASL